MFPERQTQSGTDSGPGSTGETDSPELQTAGQLESAPESPAEGEKQQALADWKAALEQQAKVLDEFPDYALARDWWSKAAAKLKETEGAVALAEQQAREDNPEIGELEDWLEMTGEELAEKSQEIQRLEQEITPERKAARDLGEPYLGPLAAELGLAQEEHKWLEDQILVSQARVKEALGKYTPLGNAKWYLNQAQRDERSAKRAINESVEVAKKEHQSYIEALARLESAEQRLKLVAGEVDQAAGQDDLISQAA